MIYLLQHHSLFMKPVHYIFVILFVLSGIAGANNDYADSLRNVIHTTDSDTEKLDAMVKLSFHYLYTYPDSVEKYALIISELGEKNNSVKYKFYGYKWRAIAEYTRGNLPEATRYYLKAADICKELDNDDEMIQCKTNIGVLYHKQGYLYLALKSYLEAIDLFERTGIKDGAVYNNVAEIYYEQGQYEKAMPYHEKSLEIYTEKKDEQGIAYCNNFEGDLFFKDKNYHEAIKKYKEALDLYLKVKDIQGSVIQYNKLGLSYYKLGNLNKAEKYFQLSVSQYGDDVDLKEKAIGLNHLGNIYAGRGELSKAIDYSLQSLDIARKINSKKEIESAYENLYHFYAKMDNTAKALDNYILYSRVKDTITNEKYSRQIQELGIEYETEKKEKELVSLGQQNELQRLKLTRTYRIVYAAAGFLVLIIIISILFVQQQRLKNRQRASELEQKLLRAQMNPHFIFNSLIAIQNYILKNRSLEAGEYLSDFAVLMRSILNNSSKEYVTLESELEFLHNYLHLQQLRFSGAFDYTIDTDPDLDLESVGIPPMLAQPFIENSIEHGFRKKESKGIIDIKFLKNNGSIIFEVSDNGVGREEAQKSANKNHVSFAMDITGKRIKNFNRHNRKSYNFHIEDLKSGSGMALGTKVIFRVPLVFI